VFVLKRQTKCL
jgi:hypothetical protein